MKKKEFLEELDKILTEKKCPDKEDIIKDFEEHFVIGQEEGKSEEEIAKLLGNPSDIAEQFKEEIEEIEETKKKKPAIVNEPVKDNNQTKKENDSSTKLILALCLIFFNLVFVLGLVTGLFGALIGFIAAFITVAVTGIVLVIVGILGLILGTVIIPTSLMALALMFSGIGTTALGILGTMAAVWLTIQFCKLLVKYCEWNVKVIRGGI